MPALELVERSPRFLWDEAIRRLCVVADSAGGPVSQIVLAPSLEVARALLRETARRAGSLAGGVPATFPDLARDLAAPFDERRAMADDEVDLVVAELLRRDPGPLGERAGRPAVIRAVARSLRDLREAGAEDLPPAAELEPELRSAAPRLEHLRRLLREYRRLLDRHRLADDAALYRAAAKAGPPPGLRHVLVHAVYDITAVQRDLVASLARTADVTWLLPVPPPDSPAAEIVERTAQILESHGFRRDRAEREPPGTPAEPAVRILACPGEEAQAREVARDILAAAGEVPFGEMAVLLSDREALERPVLAALQRAGVPVAGDHAERWEDRPSGRALSAVAELLAGEARPEAAACLLAAGDEEALPPGRVPALLRAAGCVGRPDAKVWAEALEGFAGRCEARAARIRSAAEDDDEEVPGVADPAQLERAAERSRRLAQRVRALLGKLELARARAEGGALGWQELAAQTAALAREAGLEPELCEAFEEEAAALGERLSALRPHVPLALDAIVRRVLRRPVNAPGEPVTAPAPRRPGEAVSVLDLNHARGLAARAAWVVGLSQERFGAPGPADPLLDDRLRELLRGTTGYPLKPAAERADEAEILFELARAAGRERLTLAWSRTDDVTGAVRHPADPLAQLIEALSEGGVDPSDPSTAEAVVRVPLARPDRDDADRPLLDLEEYDLAVLAEEGGPAGHLRSREDFVRALDFQRQRWAVPRFGPADGIVGEGSADGPVTASDLRDLADCPFRYFLRRVLRLGPWDDAAEELALGPREVGSLAHDVLRRIFAGRGGPRSAAESLDRAVAESLAAIAPAHDAARRLWEAAAAEVRDRLALYLLRELPRLEQDGAVPQETERDLDAEIEAEGASLRFRGRADRIDRRSEEYEIVDYKWTAKTRISDERLLRGGKALQLPLYAIAARKKGYPVASVRLVPLKGDKDVRISAKSIEARRSAIESLLGLLLERRRRGDFFPFAEDRCRWCDFVALCGPARARHRARKEGDRRHREQERLEETYP
ncbi:MAG: PD-(D/E)XK nuclease family protein [Acidobacteria bacterium]|nr:MAG: PD-(D/E)XK nuclease family protein [Acidobacteriota bacterium]